MSDVAIEPFIANRRDPRVIDPPSAARRLSVAEAYAVQDRLRDALLARGECLVGWKAGLTSVKGQQQCEVEEPVSAFLLASGVFTSGAEVPAKRFVDLVAEAEIAFVMRHALAGPGVTPARALLAVEGALPALELVDFRFGGKILGTDLIADGVFANAIVLGNALTSVTQLDLSLEGLVYELSGVIAATNTAAEVMGSPANSLAWLANHLGSRGLSLRAGDVVMSGSISALLRPKVGDTVRATFTRLGCISVRIV